MLIEKCIRIGEGAYTPLKLVYHGKQRKVHPKTAKAAAENPLIQIQPDPKRWLEQ